MPKRSSKKLGFDKAARFLVHKHPKWSIAALLLIFILIVILGYRFKWGWTGLTEHVGPNTQQYQPTKTLWDWLNLLGVLGIPVAVAFGSLWFTVQQSKAQDAENKDNQRERALQEYIDKISDLLLKEKLRDSYAMLSDNNKLVFKETKVKHAEEVRTIARARTLTALTGLDGNRKRRVWQFLYESGLIQEENPIISLNGADLSDANLSGTYLIGVDLSDANLCGANLMGSDIRRANLMYANLCGANLSPTNLSDAGLILANLCGANLRDADLCGTWLRGADLRDADLCGASLYYVNLRHATNATPNQLAQAQSLEGTTLPDGSSIENPGDPGSFASQILAIWKQQGRSR